MRSRNGHESTFPGFSSPNGTIVPDEFFDVLMTQLSESELRVCLYIMRRTFGFKKQTDDISLKQMVEGITTKEGRHLDNGAGVSRASAIRAVTGLLQKGVIVKRNNRSAERGDEATTYALRFISDPGSQFETPSRVSVINSPGCQHETHNQQSIQETDENLSKFERSHGRTFADAGDVRQPPSMAPAAPATAPDALASAQRPIRPLPSGSRLTGPENASETASPPPLASPGFAQARAAIRATLATRLRREGEARRRAPRIAVAAPIAPSPADPASSAPPRRRGRPLIGTSEERDLVLAYLDDFNRELLHDDAPLASLVTQTINIFRAAHIPRDRWPDYLYQARTAVKEHAGSITTRSRGNAERKNRGPYYFAVLRDLVAGGEG